MNPQKDTRSIIVYNGTTASRDFSLESAERGYKIVPHTTLWHTAKRKLWHVATRGPPPLSTPLSPGWVGGKSFRVTSSELASQDFAVEPTRDSTCVRYSESTHGKHGTEISGFSALHRKTMEHTNRKAKSCKHEWKLTICG